MLQNVPIVPSHSYFVMFLPITVNLYSCHHILLFTFLLCWYCNNDVYGVLFIVSGGGVYI